MATNADSPIDRQTAFIKPSSTMDLNRFRTCTWMGRAIELAQAGRDRSMKCRVGAVIVRGGQNEIEALRTSVESLHDPDRSTRR